MSEEISKFIVIIRPEFMCFCKDACRAASFNHLLFRIAGKCKDQPKAKIQDGKILWYANNEQITEEMSNAWGVCKVRQEINDLITMGLIGRTKDPAWGVNRTKHFFFSTKECEVFLHLCQENNICFVHLDLPDEVKHLIYSSNANDKSIKCICEKHQMQAIDISDASDISIEAITKIDNKEIHKEDNKEERDVASATARSQPFSQQQHVSFVDDEETKRGNVNVFTWTFGPVITPLTLTQNRTIPSPKEVVDGHVNKHPVVDHHLPAHRDQPVPRSASKRDTKPQRPRQQGLMETKPVEPELSSEATAIMDKWDSVNKRPVPRTASVIEGATLLIPCNPTAEELDTCKKWLFTTDDPKKPWFRKIGVGLLDVAKNFSKWQSLQEVQPGKEESNGYRVISSFDDPNFTMDGEFYPSEKEKKAHYAAHPIGGTRS